MTPNSVSPQAKPLTKEERDIALITVASGALDADAEYFISGYEATCLVLESECSALTARVKALEEESAALKTDKENDRRIREHYENPRSIA